MIDLVGRLAASAGLDGEVFAQPRLNALLSLGPDGLGRGPGAAAVAARRRGGSRPVVEPHLLPAEPSRCSCRSRWPTTSTSTPASTTPPTSGRSSGPDGEPLTPNWRHLPIGYHGRAGTVVSSGTAVVRPQRPAQGPRRPTRPPSARADKLDFEAELGFVVGVGSGRASRCRGRRVRRARVRGGDLERLVGPRPAGLGVRAARARSSARASPPRSRPGCCRWPLWTRRAARCHRRSRRCWTTCSGRRGRVRIDVEVWLNGDLVSSCPYAAMYYSPAQMVAHLTINGASLRTGDLLGSGTISGPAAGPARIAAGADLERVAAAAAGRRGAHLPGRRRRGGDARRRAAAPRWTGRFGWAGFAAGSSPC